MRPRAVLGLGLSCGGLSLGLWTAWIAAGNHALGRELDERNRECDALEVWNESLVLEVQAAEEGLLSGAGARPGIAVDSGAARWEAAQ